MEEGVGACKAGDWAKARAVLGDLLRDTNAVTVVLWAARAELGMGLCDRALRLTLQVGGWVGGWVGCRQTDRPSKQARKETGKQ